MLALHIQGYYEDLVPSRRAILFREEMKCFRVENLAVTYDLEQYPFFLDSFSPYPSVPL